MLILSFKKLILLRRPVAAFCFIVSVSGCAPFVDTVTTDPVEPQLTSTDLEYIRSATQLALETLLSSETHRWYNPGSNNRGEITPLRTIKTESPRGFCRVYEQRVMQGLLPGNIETATLMACRESQNQWRVCKTDPQSCIENLKSP